MAMEEKLNVLIAGKSGVGKTTLMNTMFWKKIGGTRVGAPVTMGIEHHEVEGFPITVYDVRGFEIGKSTEGIMASIRDEIEKHQYELDRTAFVDAILYCIAHPGDRVDLAEADFITELTGVLHVPVYIVFTKAYMVDIDNFDADPLHAAVKALLRERGVEAEGFYPVLCEPLSIPAVHVTVDAFGVNELIDELKSSLPPLKAAALNAARRRRLDLACKEAREWVWVYTAANFAAGALIPPGADIAALAAVEATMSAHISTIILDGQTVSDRERLAGKVSALGGPMLASVVGPLIFEEGVKVAGYVAAIPTAGTAEVVAAGVGGTVAAAITIAMGRTVIWIMRGLVDGNLSEEALDIKSKKEAAAKFKKQLKRQMQKNMKDADEEVKQSPLFEKDKPAGAPPAP